MISEKLQQAINDQIVAEMWSSNLYLSMSFYLQKEGFDGLAHWMRLQSQEELQHAYELGDFIVKRGGTATVNMIDVVPTSWNNPQEVFENVYQHECHVSELIHTLVNVANEENDKAAQYFLWGYVREQIEEEATALNIAEKLKRCNDHASLLYMDDKLGARK